MKMKTHKGTAKRIKRTKKGKLLKGKVNASHLKAKVDVSKKYKQKRKTQISTKGYVKKLKKLLGI